MTLYEKICVIYPDLSGFSKDNPFFNGTICLQNDSNGKGDYIAAWNHPTLPQPTQAQLDGVK